MLLEKIALTPAPEILGDLLCTVVLGGKNITFEVSFPFLSPSVPTQEMCEWQNAASWDNSTIQKTSAERVPKVWKAGANLKKLLW